MPSDDTPLLTSNPRWTRHIILSTVGGVLGALQFGLATSALNQVRWRLVSLTSRSDSRSGPPPHLHSPKNT